MTAPAIFTWDGEVMHPLHRFAKLCAKQFERGQEYRLAELQERSSNTHNHYFACVHDAWQNLPEDQAERFPTADHLRKWALIKTGFLHGRSVVVDSPASAAKVAAFILPMDEFAIVTVAGPVVRVYTAKSQSMRNMGAKDFQASKVAVLEYLAAMVGTSRAELEAQQ